MDTATMVKPQIDDEHSLAKQICQRPKQLQPWVQLCTWRRRCREALMGVSPRCAQALQKSSLPPTMRKHHTQPVHEMPLYHL